MFSSSSRAFLIAAVVGGVMLSACGNSEPQGPEVTPVTSRKPAASKVAGLPAEMVAAVSGGKTATVISVHFALGSAPEVNRTLPIDIAVVPHRAFSSVRANFETHDGLTTTEGESFGPTDGAAAEKPIMHRLVLLPNREGVFMVTAIVETEDDEGSVTRIFSIPVIVRTATTAASSSVAPAQAKPQTPAEPGS